MQGDGQDLSFTCGSLIPGCDAVFAGASEEEILEQVAVHAREAHGIEAVSPELAGQVRSEIKRAQ